LSASYGSLARFKDMERMLSVGEGTLLGFSGDMSDFQYLKNALDYTVSKEYSLDDGHKMSAANYFHHLTTLMYHRRNKMNPLWNNIVVAGVKNGETYANKKKHPAVTNTVSAASSALSTSVVEPTSRARSAPATPPTSPSPSSASVSRAARRRSPRRRQSPSSKSRCACSSTATPAPSTGYIFFIKICVLQN